MIHPTHELYKCSDFSTDEIYNGSYWGNANVVCEMGLGVCKKCNACESELDQPCNIPKDEDKQ